MVRSLACTVSAACVLAAAGGAAAGNGHGHGNGNPHAPSVQVPWVILLERQAAVARLHHAGLHVKVTLRGSFDVPRGVVINQRPDGTATVPRGSTVTIIVSSGKPIVTVPNVVGKRAAAALTQLALLGLQPRTERVASSLPLGTVIAERPAAGTKVKYGAVVVIRVSRG